MSMLRRHALVLSVYLNTRGFAFIVFEGHLSPFDWGIRETRGPRKNNTCLIRITTVFDRYAPDALVIQNTSESGTERARRIRNLNSAIVKLAEARGIPVFAYSRDQVRRTFEPYGCPNKESLAELIAKHIPAFEQYVPPRRRSWMSEDRRMGLFDAAALALVFFQTLASET
ncbi:Holliday junction resolvasome RuvABC endonuclease subunit [Bradyrhizobium sp. Rc2d]|uniref:hypothetical protein n=1 Tax=Bradyrhizobium sp. Rc2d TaxID=1855321 RepID=UPI00088619A2|nr:hypothetical protein [Bradyrhizobium sp. Rc2d]SDG43964.1 Holliday junction resolvasome RuvABC endonuclease subunit [Bradyrhizobium sp. Rc2d]